MSILSLTDWLDTPQGRYLLQWEQAMLDRLVADIFGYHALQVGLPEVDFLRANRMPFRFHSARFGSAVVVARAEALPFASASLDLVVLPHVLEFSATPHQVLREVERVLMPEGSVVLSGFNPYSLWGLRRVAAGRRGAFPWRGQYLSPFRIKDWMTLLGMETQAAGFGCFAPAVRSEQWLARWRFMDDAGARWWPVCGAAYVLHGIKRVQGMRLITPNWREKRATAKRMAPIAERGRTSAGTRKTQ
ncbi:class I SAM-dependent methyltransferase [Pseudothauera nasutitermitis]|uniref:Class I SAM-dependent methyltransferase n=1 Tax=Pseudothauera nasutitermitis TaxID=2565930 RepID=A0A4S4B4G3_9RHOO|nr:class I SAM-dependent methyltransferase [Pseudothauera nasutitermitis]THF67475.1 class I SAM-dependent methyltransferase [Pseudothauera nasutitermitis]